MNSASLLTRQLHDRVVGLHALRLRFAAFDGRHVPLVFLVVEHRRVGHVIRRVHRRLNREERLRVADVPAKIRGHVAHGPEQRREDAPVGGGNRILRIGEVERRRAVVRIHHDLHGVADVVDVVRGGRRVRILVRVGVGVLDPEQPPAGEHEIRVGVVREKRRDHPHALVDPAVEQDAAVVGDVVAEEDLLGAEPHRERSLAPERVHRHAAAAGVRGRHVVLATRVVELPRAASARTRSRSTARRSRGSAPSRPDRRWTPAAGRRRTAPAVLPASPG